MEYCNGAVPPDVVTVIVLVPPLHKIGVADADTLITGGSVMVTGTVIEQPFASVTVNV
jgi:hypothetical protein